MNQKGRIGRREKRESGEGGGRRREGTGKSRRSPLPYSFVRDILLRNNVRIARAIIAISEERRWETPMRNGEIKGGRGGGERERERGMLCGGTGRVVRYSRCYFFMIHVSRLLY